MGTLTAIFGLLTVNQWIEVAAMIPTLISTAEKVGEDVHPAITKLSSIIAEHKAAGKSDAVSNRLAAEVMPGWIVTNAQAAIDVQDSLPK